MTCAALLDHLSSVELLRPWLCIAAFARAWNAVRVEKPDSSRLNICAPLVIWNSLYSYCKRAKCSAKLCRDMAIALSFSKLHLRLIEREGFLSKNDFTYLSQGRLSRNGNFVRRCRGSRRIKCSIISFKHSRERGVPLMAKWRAASAISFSSAGWRL